MSALLTKKFKHSLAKDLLLSFSNNVYYTAMGKPLPFAEDQSPPSPVNSVATHIATYNDMVFGKHIRPADVRIMTRRVDWEQGAVYTAYDHDRSDLFDYETRFYVVVNEGPFYSVFKCLDNNSGAPSTHAPSLFETSAEDRFYMTGDGYVWKFMYSVPKNEFEKFASPTFIPIVANTDVTANAVSGSIDNIQIVNRGSRYNSYTNGSIQVARVGGDDLFYEIEPGASSNDNFYSNCTLKIVSGAGAGQMRRIEEYVVTGGKKYVVVATAFNDNDIPEAGSRYEITPSVFVNGDGVDFVGRALVNAVSNTISAVEILDGGRSYSWADAQVYGNTGIIDAATSKPIQANNAVLRVIISPPGGHGSDVENELGGSFLGISQTFDTVEAGGKLVANNDFRVVSIIKSPLFSNVAITTSNQTAGFSIGETVTQTDTGAHGTVASINNADLYLTNVLGLFESGNSSYGMISGDVSGAAAQVSALASTNPGLYFDQTLTLIANQISTAVFREDGELYQGSHANGSVYSANIDPSDGLLRIKLTNTKGVFNQAETGTSSGVVYSNTSDGIAAANVESIKLPDLVKGSGEVLYIENISPIARANGQTETIKIIVEF